jgi:hypothetical protein
MRLIILPQALKLVIPGIVNTFIGLFKDTTLVLIIGLFDLLGIVQQPNDPNWSPRKRRPACFARGLLHFCFGMSRYSMYHGARLDTGHKSLTGEGTMVTTTAAASINQGPTVQKMTVSDRCRIEIIGMNKWYGEFHVLRDINLTVIAASAS